MGWANLYPGARVSPIGIRGSGGNVEDRRGLLDRQAAEVAQLNESGSPGVPEGQPAKRLVERQQVLGGLRGGDLVRFEGLGRAAAAALLTVFAAGVLDQDAAHGLGRGGEEVPAAFP